ncbi:MFS siderochrome iron transporter 1 [Exophiala dermatitidis]
MASQGSGPGALGSAPTDRSAGAEYTDQKITDKEAAVSGVAPDHSDDENLVDPNEQRGVQLAEAMTAVWTMRDLIMAYVFIWIIEFILGFSSGIVSTLTPYVTSSFQMHSLTATASIISSLIGGIFKLPFAKIMDIWGRPQAFILMVISITVGLIMMAACNNVETYCAAQVFYNVGYNGIDFAMTIFIADTSKTAQPSIYDCICLIALACCHMAIVLPITCAPLYLLFVYNQRKAKKMGLIPDQPSHGTPFQTVMYYAREFDVIGLLLISTGMALFLLSFSLYSYQRATWESALIICFVVIGGLLIIAFAMWEKYFAPVTFVPWPLLRNRTVLFIYIMAASIYSAWYIWDSYFYSMLIVVFRQTVTRKRHIGNIYTIESTFWALVIGVCIRINGRLKWYALCFGVPMTILGVGLMIHSRQPDVNIGYIVMTQILIAFGGGTLVSCEQMTVMAVSRHGNIPAVLAVEAMVAAMGSSVGSTIAAAMWTGIFPKKLMKNLPDSAKGDFASIYGDLTVQSSYPPGSPTRIAIDKSYGQTQKLMLITATCLYSITLSSTFFRQDVDVKNMKQRTKGLI